MPTLMDDTLNPTALLLVQENFLSIEAARQYQQAAQAHGYRLLPYLVAQAQLCPKTVAQLLAKRFGLPWVDLNNIDLGALPKQFLIANLLRQYHVLPIQYDTQHLYLAIDDPNQIKALKEIQFLTNCPILIKIAQSIQLSTLIDEVLRDTDHQGLTHYVHAQQIPMMQSGQLTTEHLHDIQDEQPIVAFVQRLLQQAIVRGATDLHFEPYADYYRIRYRQDGQLYELARPPQIVTTRIAARLKIMADLDITERRLPQDGRFNLDYLPTQTIDCRLSTCPTIYGEKIAIRFLNSGIIQPNLEQLELSERDKQCFLQALRRQQGLILVTGPTGSGKTVTLYAALNYLNNGEKNISSVEDPVEIKLSGINQVQINPKIGLTFAKVLRTFLRQDPDIMMLGEIRDSETADMAIKAAHTGHLVLSTLHTKNCVQTLGRLKQLGITPFLLMSNLTLIVAQRLIRMLCSYCKTPTQMPNGDLMYQAQGCHRCHQGYHGRKAIFEVMPISETMQDMIAHPKLSISEISAQAAIEGMLTLRQAGLIQVIQGVTSFAEINALT